MAIRAVDADVTGIIDVASSISLTPFIAAANILVDQLAAVDAANEACLAATELTQIEVWIAAHFYAVRDPQLKTKKTGDASGTFRGSDDMFLSSTLHGQTAMLLDKTNWLAKRDKEAKEGLSKTATVNWGGTEYSSANQNIH